MEEGVDLLNLIKQNFDIKGVDIRTYSPLTLAYIGDGIFDLIVRTIVVERGNAPVNKLNRRTTAVVKAETQAAMIQALFPDLTEEEMKVYKRGRNASPCTIAKNASRSDYLKATGLEALMGYLYLTGRQARMIELVKTGLNKLEIVL